MVTPTLEFTLLPHLNSMLFVIQFPLNTLQSDEESDSASCSHRMCGETSVGASRRKIEGKFPPAEIIRL